MLVLAFTFAVATDTPLYVQASAINLRAAPAVTGKFVAEVGIGAACAALEAAKDEWIHLRCQGEEGWAKREFLGDAPPRLEDLLTKSRSAAKPSERLSFALRALTLRPAAKNVQDNFFAALFPAEFAGLDEQRSKTPGQAGAFPCDDTATPNPAEQMSPAEMKDCAVFIADQNYLNDGTARVWHQIELRGHDFIAAMLLATGEWYVLGGAVKGGRVYVEYGNRAPASKALIDAFAKSESSILGGGLACYRRPGIEDDTTQSDFCDPIDAQRRFANPACAPAWISCQKSNCEGCLKKSQNSCRGCQLACKAADSACSNACATGGWQDSLYRCQSNTRCTADYRACVKQHPQRKK